VERIMKRGVGYTPPPGVVVYWNASRWGDERDSKVSLPLIRGIDPRQPFAGDSASMVRRYCAPDRIAASLNGPYIMNGGLNTERGNSSTAAAFSELQRRFQAGEIGNPAEWDGWPTDQETWDLVVAEWPAGASRKPAWPEFADQPPATPPLAPPPVVVAPPPAEPNPPATATPPPLKPAAARADELLAWADARAKAAPLSLRLSYTMLRRWPGLHGVLVELLEMVRTALRNAKERP
jgi:hypothetical protein